MPQLDKVTFYYQSFIVTIVFLVYHFYAIRAILKPLYGNLKMRETCCWWADFDRDLADWWFGEHNIFTQVSKSWCVRVVGALHRYYTTDSLLPETVNILYNDYFDMCHLRSSRYFFRKYKLIQRAFDFVTLHKKNNQN